MTAKQLQLVQEIEQKFKELQETVDGDKYISASSRNNDFHIYSNPYGKGEFDYFNGKEVVNFYE